MRIRSNQDYWSVNWLIPDWWNRLKSSTRSISNFKSKLFTSLPPRLRDHSSSLPRHIVAYLLRLANRSVHPRIPPLSAHHRNSSKSFICCIIPSASAWSHHGNEGVSHRLSAVAFALESGRIAKLRKFPRSLFASLALSFSSTALHYLVSRTRCDESENRAQNKIYSQTKSLQFYPSIYFFPYSAAPSLFVLRYPFIADQSPFANLSFVSEST